MKRELLKKGVEFVRRTLSSLDELIEQFDVVVNCAGLNGGRLAGDDDTVFPIRGVSFEVMAPWHKHFLYRDFLTFTIPMSNSVLIGSVKQSNRSDLLITDIDRADILNRYYQLHPAMKGTAIIREWSGLRPERVPLRLEAIKGKRRDGSSVMIIHNYGHGGNGFTLSWGCAQRVVDLIDVHTGRGGEEKKIKSRL